MNQFKTTVSCLHKPDEETTFILCAFICGQKASSIWFTTAFSHTANNWVHDTLANSVVHLTGNLCTLLTLKKICQCLECCSVQTVGKKYVTQIINGESLIPDIGKAIIFWSHWHISHHVTLTVLPTIHSSLQFSL